MAENKEGIKVISRKDGKIYSIRPHRERIFFPDEWMKFYDALKLDKQKITFNILINTGARINEARGITPGDIDFRNKRIVLRNTKVRVKEGEKNPTPRIIPVSTQFLRFLKNKIEEYSLKSNDRFPFLKTPAANLCLKRTLKRIGVKDWYMFSVHNIRKTFETWLLALNVDLWKIVIHLGHKTTTAIKHYVSPDAFSFEEKKKIRMIIGDLYNE